MACSLPFAFLVTLSLLLPSALAGGVICEDLGEDLCAFAVSSSGRRCVLESYRVGGRGPVEYQCRTSEVATERVRGHVETEQCVRACGVERKTVGISSDALLDSQFAAKLCSPACHNNCPNIIDLYFNLAAGEGVFLPDLCKANRSNPRRAMAELLSSGVAAGPAASEGSSVGRLDVAVASSPAPAPAPAAF